MDTDTWIDDHHARPPRALPRSRLPVSTPDFVSVLALEVTPLPFNLLPAASAVGRVREAPQGPRKAQTDRGRVDPGTLDEAELTAAPLSAAPQSTGARRRPVIQQMILGASALSDPVPDDEPQAALYGMVVPLARTARRHPEGRSVDPPHLDLDEGLFNQSLTVGPRKYAPTARAPADVQWLLLNLVFDVTYLGPCVSGGYPMRAYRPPALGGQHVWTATSLGGTATIAIPTGVAAAVSASGSLTALTTYYYVVTALTAAGETTASAEVNATTTATDLTIDLTWQAVFQATGYRVYRGTVSGTHDTLVAQVTGASHADDGTATLGSKSSPATNTAAISMDVVEAASWVMGTASRRSAAPTVRRSAMELPQQEVPVVPLFPDWIAAQAAPPRQVRRPPPGSQELRWEAILDVPDVYAWMTTQAGPARPADGPSGQADVSWVANPEYVADNPLAWQGQAVRPPRTVATHGWAVFDVGGWLARTLALDALTEETN